MIDGQPKVDDSDEQIGRLNGVLVVKFRTPHDFSQQLKCLVHQCYQKS